MASLTTPAPTYTPPTTSILHHTNAGFNSRPLTPPVHLMQYDRTLPVIAVSLRGGEMGEKEYTVPEGAAVNVRMEKTDGYVVYNPALGLDAARKTAYIGVTAQMTTCAGPATAIVEIIVNGGVAGTAPIALDITPNPVSEDAIESGDEFLALDDLVKQAAESASAAAASASAAEKSQTKATASATAAEASKAAAASSAAEAAASQTAAAGSAAAAQDAANAAAGSASDAAASAALAEQHAVPVSDAAINASGHLILTLSNGNQVDAGEVRGPRGPEGVEGPAGESAYEAAAAGGYTGTEAAFRQELAGLPTLYGRFDSSGAANNAAALGGTPAAAVTSYSTATFYVSETGNDTTGTGTSAKPWRTIQKAVNAIRPYHKSVTVSVAAGNYPERVIAQYINCTLYITGKSTGHAVLRGITAMNCQSLILQHLDFTETDNTVETGLLHATNCRSVHVRDGIMTGNDKQRGLRIETSSVYAARLQISHCLSACYIIYRSQLNAFDISGSDNGTAVYSSLSTVSLMRSSISAQTPVSTTNNGTVTIDGAAYNTPATSLGGYEAGHYLNKLYQTGEGAPTASTAGHIGQRYVDTVTLDSYISQGGTDGNYKWAKLANVNLLPNRNLLDNGYFPDPVNQRGQTSANGSYWIDRWIGTNIMIANGGITSTAPNGQVIQRLEPKLKEALEGKQATLSCLVKYGDHTALYTGTITYESSLPAGTNKYFWVNDIVHGAIRDDGFILLWCANAYTVILAAKLELGEHQTLAHPDASGNWVLNDPPPNKALELMKCQRYYQRHNLNAYLYASGVSGVYELSIQYPEMRANPAVTFVAGSAGLSAELVSTTAFVARSNNLGDYVGGVVLDAEL